MPRAIPINATANTFTRRIWTAQRSPQMTAIRKA
jgi:hypothetical protein